MFLTTTSDFVLAASLAQVLVTGAAAATTTTSSSVASFLLPSRSTSAGYHIYASAITSDATTTQYLLGCQSQVSATSYSCDGDFNSLTLTYGASSMHLNLGPKVGVEYDCQLSPAVCTITSSGIVATSTIVSLAASEMSQSMTPVTVLMAAASTTSSSSSTTTTAATTSGGSEVCKRKVKSGSDGSTGGDDGSTCSSGGRFELGLVLFGATAVAALVGVVIL